MGRKLFWIFVAIGGFLIGWFLAPAIWPSLVIWQRIVIGIILAVVFALLSLLFLRAMAAIGGFFLFGAATVVLIRSLSRGRGGRRVLGLLARLHHWWSDRGDSYLHLPRLGAHGPHVTGRAGSCRSRHPLCHVADARGGWLEGVLFVVAAVGIVFQAWTYRGGRYRIWRRSA